VGDLAPWTWRLGVLPDELVALGCGYEPLDHDGAGQVDGVPYVPAGVIVGDRREVRFIIPADTDGPMLAAGFAVEGGDDAIRPLHEDELFVHDHMGDFIATGVDHGLPGPRHFEPVTAQHR